MYFITYVQIWTLLKIKAHNFPLFYVSHIVISRLDELHIEYDTWRHYSRAASYVVKFYEQIAQIVDN